VPDPFSVCEVECEVISPSLSKKEANLATASCASLGSTEEYRVNIARVLCPVSSIVTVFLTPARCMFVLKRCAGGHGT
jgi:hypothetical protein